MEFCPSLWGGKNWPPTAYNPDLQYWYIPVIESCNRVTHETMTTASLKPREFFTGGGPTNPFRITGSVTRTTRDESDTYFQSRPFESRIGAWASPQSRVVSGRDELDSRYAECLSTYPSNVPLPPFWGGYRVVPERIEFWQGRKSRLHDRLLYEKNADGTWTRSRLAP